MQKLTLKANTAYKIEDDGMLRVRVFKNDKIIAQVVSFGCGCQVIYQKLKANGVEIEYPGICDFEEVEG